MSKNYKVIFREEGCLSEKSALKWEVGCPLMLSAVQISRNTETAQAYLQAKAMNISENEINEVFAEAVIQYSDNSTETLRLDNLDADIPPSATYLFSPAILSRGDAVRADIRVMRAKLANSVEWASCDNPINVERGEKLNLSKEYATARNGILRESGCCKVADATSRIVDKGSYWICTCGQVNLAAHCANCKVGRTGALKSEDMGSLEERVARSKEEAARSKEEATRSKEEAVHLAQKRKKIALIAAAAVCLVAIIAGIVYLMLPTLEGYFREHKVEWDSAVAQIEQSGGDYLDVDMSVSRNKISQIMTYKRTYSAEEVKAMKASFKNATDNLKTAVSKQIKSMEEETGISGITWYFEYRNGDGSLIYALDVSAS